MATPPDRSHGRGGLCMVRNDAAVNLGAPGHTALQAPNWASEGGAVRPVASVLPSRQGCAYAVPLCNCFEQMQLHFHLDEGDSEPGRYIL